MRTEGANIDRIIARNATFIMRVRLFVIWGLIVRFAFAGLYGLARRDVLLEGRAQAYCVAVTFDTAVATVDDHRL